MRELTKSGPPTPLHEAAWPRLFEDLQTAYAELTRAQQELQSHAGALAEANDLVDRVLESMADAVFVLDRSGRVARTNDAAAALIQRDPEDIRGRAFVEVWTTPDLPTTPLELVQRAPGGQLREVDVRLRVGRAERALSASCMLVRDARGCLRGRAG